MFSSNYAAWVYVLAWVWVVVSLAIVIQMYRLRNEDWPSLGWNWPRRRRRRELGCILGFVLAMLAIAAFNVFVLLLFFSGFVYVVAASLLGDLNGIGGAVAVLTGGVVGFFALIGIYSSLFDTR